MPGWLSVAEVMVNKTQAQCTVFCVFELYQFEREQYKNINKISPKNLTPLMGLIWTLAAEWPVSLLQCYHALTRPMGPGYRRPRVQALWKRSRPGRLTRAGPEASAACVRPQDVEVPQRTFPTHSSEAEPVSKVFLDSLLWTMPLCLTFCEVSIV